MKKVIVITVFLLLSSIPFTESTEQIKILVDESRVDKVEKPEQWMIEFLEAFGYEYEEPEDPYYSFENTIEDFGFGTIAKKLRTKFSLSIKKSGSITYDNLKNYDVLFICSFQKSYTSAEVEAIRQFIENGGGLLFAAHYDSPNNSVSRPFGVLFPSNVVSIEDDEDKDLPYHRLYVTDFVPHPITEGITQILLDDGVPIVSYESGDVLAKTGETSEADALEGETGLDNDSGPFDILLVQSVGKGRAVFFGGRDTFYNFTVEEPNHQNVDLLINMVQWLGEPGGPYKQYTRVNEQAQQLFSDALSLYQSSEFLRAKQRFEEAMDLFEESNEIYRSIEAEQGIRDAETYIAYCDIGMEAKTAFDKAIQLFDQRNLEDAIEEFENAQSLYQEIGFDEQVNAAIEKIEESKSLITVRQEATTFLNQAQDAMDSAPSTFSSAGFEKAKSLFEQAKSKWEQYGDLEKASRCGEQIAYCENEIAAIKKTRTIVIGAVVGLLAVGAAAVVFVKKRTV